MIHLTQSELPLCDRLGTVGKIYHPYLGAINTGIVGYPIGDLYWEIYNRGFIHLGSERSSKYEFKLRLCEERGAKNFSTQEAYIEVTRRS